MTITIEHWNILLFQSKLTAANIMQWARDLHAFPFVLKRIEETWRRSRNKLLWSNEWLGRNLVAYYQLSELEQFEKTGIRIFLVEKISTSLLTLFAKCNFSRLEMHDVYLMRKNMLVWSLKQIMDDVQTSRGIQLFIVLLIIIIAL